MYFIETIEDTIFLSNIKLIIVPPDKFIQTIAEVTNNDKKTIEDTANCEWVDNSPCTITMIQNDRITIVIYFPNKPTLSSIIHECTHAAWSFVESYHINDEEAMIRINEWLCRETIYKLYPELNSCL